MKHTFDAKEQGLAGLEIIYFEKSARLFIAKVVSDKLGAKDILPEELSFDEEWSDLIGPIQKSVYYKGEYVGIWRKGIGNYRYHFVG